MSSPGPDSEGCTSTQLGPCSLSHYSRVFPWTWRLRAQMTPGLYQFQWQLSQCGGKGSSPPQGTVLVCNTSPPPASFPSLTQRSRPDPSSRIPYSLLCADIMFLNVATEAGSRCWLPCTGREASCFPSLSFPTAGAPPSLCPKYTSSVCYSWPCPCSFSDVTSATSHCSPTPSPSVTYFIITAHFIRVSAFTTSAQY